MEMNKHTCKPPKSSDFKDGQDAAGCWMDGDDHVEQVVGSSGVYLIVTDWTGKVVRDERPWRMRE